mgnify:CR=1 FL=1
MKVVIYFLIGFLLSFRLEAETIKIGSLQYGSVNWELKLIKELELDKKNNFNLEIVELASKNAAAVALQGGAVDLIVTDWFWVSRQRSEGRLFSFVPHSMAAGGLIAPKDSNIVNDIDLKNKKIGIAGGQVDKGWLIFRAFYKKKSGEDLIKLSKPIFVSELATEFMMNALRLKNGVPIDYFEKRTGRTYEEIEQKLLDLQSKGLIALDKKRLKTSELGYRFLNSTLEKF